MASPPRTLARADADAAADLARRLSPEHVREIRETTGLAPGDALRLSLAQSMEAHAFAPGDGRRVTFMMGVTPPDMLTGGALLWMLASTEAFRRPAALLRAASWGVDRAFAVTGATRLEQFIPDWYGAGIRFVRRLGFAARPTPLHARSGARLWHVVRRRQSGAGGTKTL